MIIKKKFSVFLLCIGFILATHMTIFANNQEISLIVNGNRIENMDAPPVILYDNTMVPARDVFEPLGAAVRWNPATQSVYIGYVQDLIILEIDNNIASFNGNNVLMNMEARIINDRTMIPVRFVAETLGFDVDWDESTRTVYIDSGSEDTIDEVVDDTVIVVSEDEINSMGVDLWQDTPINVENVGNVPAITEEEHINAEQSVNLPTMQGQIRSIDFPQTRIVDIHIPDITQAHFFTIEASSEISMANYFIVDNDRLVIDIHNASMNVLNTDVTINNSPNVSRIRVAQNEVQPVQITRIVMELVTLSEYAVFISEDRRTLYVSFEESVITDINIVNEEHADYINIVGTKMTALHVSNTNDLNVLVIDIPNSVLDNVSQPIASGRFIRGLQVSQLNQNTVRMVVHLNQQVVQTISYAYDVVTIRMGEPGFRNITFNSFNNLLVIERDSRYLFNVSDITHIDDYHNRRYTLVLPGDFSSLLGYGEINVDNDLIDTIEILTQNGNTNLVINTNTFAIADVTQVNDNIHIQIISPRDRYAKIVMLDPGHGGADGGAAHFGVVEKDVVLTISNMVRDMLRERSDIKVYTTRSTDVFIPLHERPRLANEVADLFVSIHLNAVTNNPVPRGTETYYLVNGTDENFNITRRQVAEIFQRNLVQGLGTVDRGVRTNNFAVLRLSYMPSVLLELGFLTNPEEAAMLGNPVIQRRSADIIYASILEVFEIFTPTR